MGSRIKNTDFLAQPRLQRRHLLHREDRTLEKVSAKRTEHTLPQMNAQKGERAEEVQKAQREIGIVLSKWRNAQRNSALSPSSPSRPFSHLAIFGLHFGMRLNRWLLLPAAHSLMNIASPVFAISNSFLSLSLSPPLEGRRYLAFLAVLIDQYPDGGSAREIICADKHFYAPDTTPKSAIKKRERNFFHGWAGEEQSGTVRKRCSGPDKA